MSAQIAANDTSIGAGESRAIQIGKVRRLSRVAVVFFTCFTIFIVCVAILLLISVMIQPTGSNARITMSTWAAVGAQADSWRVKFAALVLLTPFMVLTLGMLKHLNLLFRNLSEGIIYSKDNVRHVLQTGKLWLIIGVMNLALPILTMIPLWVGFIDTKAVTMTDFKLPSGSFSVIVSAFLVILVAWVMEVGRQTQDEATQLREEASLVV